jgi:hypothetical protein
MSLKPDQPASRTLFAVLVLANFGGLTLPTTMSPYSFATLALSLCRKSFRRRSSRECSARNASRQSSQKYRRAGRATGSPPSTAGTGEEVRSSSRRTVRFRRSFPRPPALPAAITGGPPEVDPACRGSGKSAKKLRKTRASLCTPGPEEGACNVIATSNSHFGEERAKVRPGV